MATRDSLRFWMSRGSAIVGQGLQIKRNDWKVGQGTENGIKSKTEETL